MIFTFPCYISAILIALVASFSSPVNEVVYKPPPLPAYGPWPATVNERLDLLEEESLWPCRRPEPSPDYMTFRLPPDDSAECPVFYHVKKDMFLNSDATVFFERVLVDASIRLPPVHDALLVDLGMLVLFPTLLIQLSTAFIAWLAILLPPASYAQTTTPVDGYIPRRILRRKPAVLDVNTDQIENTHFTVSGAAALLAPGSQPLDLAMMHCLVDDNAPAGPLDRIIAGAVAAFPGLAHSAVTAAKLAVGPEPPEPAPPIVIPIIPVPAAVEYVSPGSHITPPIPTLQRPFPSQLHPLSPHPSLGSRRRRHFASPPSP
ncbi:hypothetical protein C8R43DRAFT_512428 [Mycena crocata]|nr:hypothetical protein C8R43DRAFT_512428 [Mycena crocata]